MVTPISQLTPWLSGPDATIVARVSAKGENTTTNRSHWTGKYFSVKLVDDSGEIDMCLFNEFVDWYYDLIKIGKVYILRGLHIKPRSGRSTSGVKHPYQLTSLTGYTFIQEARGSLVQHIPGISIQIRKIKDISTLPLKTSVDTFGVVTKMSSCEEKTWPSGERYKMRVITIADPSGEITLSLRGKTAENFQCGENNGDVVAVVGAIVANDGPNGTKSLKMSQLTQIHVNPNDRITQDYRGWYLRRQNGALTRGTQN